MTGIAEDCSHALRGLMRKPRFAMLAVLTFALGIGASTAIVSAVYPILIAPLPYPGADRLVRVWDVSDAGESFALTYGTFLELAARSRSFESLAVSAGGAAWRPVTGAAGEPERIDAGRVSARYFDVLGLQPAAGRGFTAADDAPGAPNVVVVDDALAVRQFGSAAAAVEKTIRLDGLAYTIVGVLPPAFTSVLSPRVEAWVPLQYDATPAFDGREWGHHLAMIGRLRDGASAADAGRELLALAAAPIEEFPRPDWAALEHGLRIEPLKSSVTRGVRPLLAVIVAAAFVLLAIACVNVTSLSLARNVERRREIATRAALGAAPSRLVRRELAESLMLAFGGGVGGLLLAALGVRGLTALAPPDLPRIEAIALNAPVSAFALAVMTFVGVSVGAVLALEAQRVNLSTSLRAATRAVAGGRHALRRGLVAAQVALALVLLIGCALLLRSVERLLSVSPGFEPADVLTLQIAAVPDGSFGRDGALRRFEQIVTAVENVPGVRSAALVNQLPMSGDEDLYGAAFATAPPLSPRGGPGAYRYAVTHGWFETMGIPLLEGRLFDAADRPAGAVPMLINDAFAKRRFGDRSPIGERVRFGPQQSLTDEPWPVIVGVVGDVRHASLALPPGDAFYVPLGRWPSVDTVQSLAVRSTADLDALVPLVREAVRSVDPALAVTRIAKLDELVAASESRRTFALTVVAIFSAAALALAALGLYGIIAGRVAERTAEIGLRAALGATPRRNLALVMREGLMLAAIGIGCGAAAALGATRVLSSLLFEIDAHDLPTYAAAALCVLAVSALAAAVPAWRAARVDPTVALHAD